MERPPPPPKDQPRHALGDLDPGLAPSKAREVSNSGVHGYTDHQVMTHLRNAFTQIVKHQSFSHHHKHLVLDGRCTSVFFLCAMGGYEAPDGDGRIRFPSIGDDAAVLPLCHWEGLYLALVVEIRQLFANFQQTWATELNYGNRVLHMQGDDAISPGKPFAAMHFLSKIKGWWTVLMDVRLLGPLEEAVRKEHAADWYRAELDDATFRQQFEAEWQNQDSEAHKKLLDHAEGMMNPHEFSTDQINDVLWQKYARKMRRACREHFNIDLDLVARRAQLVHASQMLDSGPTGEQPFCSCDEQCQCRAACVFEVGICACKDPAKRNPRENAEIARSQYTSNMQSPDYPASSRRNNRQMFGAVTSEMAQMRIAGEGMPHDPYVRQTNRQMKEIGQNSPFGPTRRERSDTENSNLAYVPDVPKTPARGVKEQYPLGLYGSDSNQRYPKFRDTTTTQAHPAPVYDGSSNYTTDPPRRKPVPSTSTTSTMSPPQGLGLSTDSGLSTSPEYPPTFISSSPEPEPEPLRPSKAKFQVPFFGKSKGKKPATTESFPAPGTGNPRQPQSEFHSWDTSHVATPHVTPQPGLFMDPVKRQPSPFGRHSADSPSRPALAPAPMMRSNTADVAQLPDLPLPDFIAPRPAMRQRYVSAGGNAKLSERPEISDFALPPAAEPGMCMNKDDFLARLASEAVTSPPRSSKESVPRASQEEAAVVDDPNRGEKRDRTTSNSSVVRNPFKRMLSRNHSSSQ